HVPRHGNRLFIDTAILVVLHHANNRHLPIETVRPDVMAQGILIRKESLRKLLIDDAHMRRGGSVGASKIAARKHRYTERSKDLGTNHMAAPCRGRSVRKLGNLPPPRQV